MPSPTNTHTFDISLHLSKILTKKVNESFASGELFSSVSPTTQKLLSFWLDDDFCNNREVNFHTGQKQAILNIIYLHEVLQINSIKDAYAKFDYEILQSFLESNIDNVLERKKIDKKDYESETEILKLNLANKNYADFTDEIEIYDNFKANVITQNKYNFIKYALKLATATGKTWVMNAIIIWQYLNKKADPQNNRWTNNFLLIAPGIIVYERLVESLRGKNDGVATSDILQNKKLFVPNEFEHDIYTFLSTSIFDKNNIENIKDGCVIVVNWHIFLDISKEDDNEDYQPKNIKETIEQILPLRPGKNKGNELNVLDKKARNFIKSIGEKLRNGLMLINDEAHHIHENKIRGVKEEVQWQKAIDSLQQQTKNLFQIDFTATPYLTSGSGATRTKNYFPHVIVDFGLVNALNNGLVKMVAMDKSSKFDEIGNLSFKAEVDQNGELALVEGQKTMIQLGLSSLSDIAKQIKNSGHSKTPKMMITCENIAVIDKVKDYLSSVEKLTEEEFFVIHSNTKNQIPDKEYQELKSRLFGLNNDNKTKVIVSALMLKEGFDTNDICVIVPLRATTSSILLEQTIGRGLRLMFRNTPTYYEAQKIRIANYQNTINKKAIVSPLDILHIVEHPAFYDEYKKLIEGGEVAEIVGGSDGEPPEMIAIELKKDYEKYDISFPKITEKPPTTSSDIEINIKDLKPYHKSLEDVLKDRNYSYVSMEMSSGNIIGEGEVNNNSDKINYQTGLIELVDFVLTEKIGKKEFPIMQHLKGNIANYLDEYIRFGLFNEKFNIDDNFDVLGIKNESIKKHIRDEFKRVFNDKMSLLSEQIDVENIKFSSKSGFNTYKNHCLKLTKTIYTQTPYPSYSGGFEKDFLIFLDKDNAVLKFIKVLEFKHTFATIQYINDKNMMQNYYPDFVVETKDNVYIVETKASKDLNNYNVKAKAKATNKYVEKINKLSAKDRGDKLWQYLIISDNKRKEIEDKSVSFMQLVNKPNHF
jgi:type III restriction enzyme